MCAKRHSRCRVAYSGIWTPDFASFARQRTRERERERKGEGEEEGRIWGNDICVRNENRVNIGKEIRIWRGRMGRDRPLVSASDKIHRRSRIYMTTWEMSALLGASRWVYTASAIEQRYTTFSRTWEWNHLHNWNSKMNSNEINCRLEDYRIYNGSTIQKFQKLWNFGNT